MCDGPLACGVKETACVGTLGHFVPLARSKDTWAMNRLENPFYGRTVGQVSSLSRQNPSLWPKTTRQPSAYLAEVTSLSPGLPPQRLPRVRGPQTRPVPRKGCLRFVLQKHGGIRMFVSRRTKQS